MTAPLLDYIHLPAFAALEWHGYTEAALRAKISQGVWAEGREYVRAPDGRIHISLQGYYAWVRGENTAAYASPAAPASRSRSSTRAASAASASRSSPPPLT